MQLGMKYTKSIMGTGMYIGDWYCVDMGHVRIMGCWICVICVDNGMHIGYRVYQ